MSRARRRGLIRLAAMLGAVAAVVIWFVATGGSGGSGGEDNQATLPGLGEAAKKAADARGYSIPPLLDPHDVYAADRPGMLSPVVRKFPSRVYVPNSESN